MLVQPLVLDADRCHVVGAPRQVYRHVLQVVLVARRRTALGGCCQLVERLTYVVVVPILHHAVVLNRVSHSVISGGVCSSGSGSASSMNDLIPFGQMTSSSY